MVDTNFLIYRLESYEAAMDRHHETLQERRDALLAAWRSLDEVYQGAAADELRQAVEQADTVFQAYLRDGDTMRAALKQKLEDLRSFHAGTE